MLQWRNIPGIVFEKRKNNDTMIEIKRSFESLNLFHGERYKIDFRQIRKIDESTM
jgi:hypothetical protein